MSNRIVSTKRAFAAGNTRVSSCCLIVFLDFSAEKFMGMWLHDFFGFVVDNE